MLLCLQAHLGLAQNPQPLPNPSLQLVTNGWVNAIVRLPDGSVVFGGAFSSANGAPRSNIAKLNPDGTLDSAWNPSASGYVYALAADSSGNNIYVGGQFTSIGGQTRRDLAKLSGIGTGAADASWNPSPSISSFDDVVTALLVDNEGNVFAGGTFTAIGGQARSNIAKLSGTGAGDADAAWNASAGGNVLALAVDGGGNVYVGGQFTTCGGQSRNNIAKVSGTDSGAADASWNPSADNTVRALVVDSSGNVYAGGDFSNIGGRSRNNIAKLSGTGTGAANASWNALTSGKVDALSVDSSGNVYAGGFFGAIGGQLRSRIAKLSGTGTGTAVTSWNPSANGPVYALIADAGGNVYAGGQFTMIGGQQHLGLGQVSAGGTTSSALTDAELPAFAVSVAVAQPVGGIIVGGVFLKANQQPRSNLLRLNADGTLDSNWNPSPDNDVEALAVDSSGNVYVGGAFSAIGGQARSHIAKLSGTGTGVADANWNPTANNQVEALTVDVNGDVYAAGSFTSIGGQSRFHLAKLAGTDAGVADASWNPSPTGNVSAFAADGNGYIYVGGNFFAIGGQSRRGIAKLSTTGTGAADATWNPSPNNNEVDALALDSSGNVYAGGYFVTIGGQSRSNIAKLSSTGTGAADATWNPSADNRVTALAVDSSGSIYASGKFNTIGERSNRIVAKLSGKDAGDADANWNPSPNNYVYPLTLDGNDNVYVGGTFTAIGGQARIGMAAFAAPPQITITSTADSIVGQSYEVDLTVTAAFATPTGTVTLTDDATPANTCGPVALSAGAASCNITWNTAGTYQLRATYTPDIGSVFTSVSSTAMHVVDPADQAITFTSSAPNGLIYGSAVPYSVTASASSGLLVTFSIDAASTVGTCSLSGNAVTFANAGTCILDANQNGSGDYNAAPEQQQSIVIGKASQTIDFGAQLPQTYATGAMFSLSPIASASSGLAVNYSSLTTNVCTMGGTTVNIVGAGSCTIAADQSGDNNYDSAQRVTQDIPIAKASTSTALATECETLFVENQPFTVSATTTETATTGSVTFHNGAAALCSDVTLSSGNASCTVGDLATNGTDLVDIYSLSAIYGGDNNHAQSTSAPLIVTVLSAADVVSRNGFEMESLACPIE